MVERLVAVEKLKCICSVSETIINLIASNNFHRFLVFSTVLHRKRPRDGQRKIDAVTEKGDSHAVHRCRYI